MAKIMEHPMWMTWVHGYRGVEETFGVQYSTQELIRGFRRYLMDKKRMDENPAARKSRRLVLDLNV